MHFRIYEIKTAFENIDSWKCGFILTILNSSNRTFVTFLKAFLGQYSQASPGLMCMSAITISSSFDLAARIH